VVLVDTSIWIAHSARPGFITDHVALDEIAVCPPVIQEVLQGTRVHSYIAVRKALFAAQILESPMGVELFEEAADIYRTGRVIGFSIRSGFDCLIAAIAIRNAVELLHSDRDFNTIARFTRLQSRYVAL
jgi:predicted nucleic acid-binding protein